MPFLHTLLYRQGFRAYSWNSLSDSLYPIVLTACTGMHGTQNNTPPFSDNSESRNVSAGFCIRDTSFYCLERNDTIRNSFRRGQGLLSYRFLYNILRLSSFHQLKIMFFKFVSIDDDGNPMKPRMKFAGGYHAERVFPGDWCHRISGVFFFADFVHFL